MFSFKFFIYFCFVYEFCVHVCKGIHVCSAKGGQKKALGRMELKLWTIMSCPVGAGRMWRCWITDLCLEGL